MQVITYSTRPIQPFSMAWRYQASVGSEALGPPQLFFRDALNDLPVEAEVECRLLCGRPAYCAREPYGIRPVHTEFNVRMGWPGRLFGSRPRTRAYDVHWSELVRREIKQESLRWRQM